MIFNHPRARFIFTLILIGAALYPFAGLSFIIPLILTSFLAFLFFNNNIIHSLMLLIFNLSFNWTVLPDHKNILLTFLIFIFFNSILTTFRPRWRLFFVISGAVSLVIIPFMNLELAMKLSLFSLLFMTNLIPLLFDFLDKSGSSKFNYFKTCFSPWNLFCVFLSPEEISSKKAKTMDDYLLSQNRALKLAILLLAVTLLKNLIITLVHPRYSFWQPFSSPSILSNFSLYEFTDGPRLHFNFLTGLLVAGFLGTMRVLYVFGTGVLLANIFGFNLQLMPKSIQSIDTFKNLILNLYHYYNRVIVKLFFIPLYRYSFITKKNKVYFKILAIIVGGVFFHAVGDFAYHTFYNTNQPPSLQQLIRSNLGWVIYFIFLIFLMFIDHSLRKMTFFQKLKARGGKFYIIGNSLYLILLLFILYLVNLKVYIPTLIP